MTEPARARWRHGVVVDAALFFHREQRSNSVGDDVVGLFGIDL